MLDFYSLNTKEQQNKQRKIIIKWIIIKSKKPTMIQQLVSTR